MRTFAFISLLAFSPLASAAEADNLVIDGIPEIPKDLAERAIRYQNTRGASLYAWAPDGSGILIGTRFAETNQVHFVKAPGAARTQLTFFAEPISGAAYDDKLGSQGFVYRMDQGGGEFFQYFWQDLGTGKSTLLTDGTSRNEFLVPSQRGGLFALASTKRNKKDFDIYTMSVDKDGKATTKLLKEVTGQWAPLAFSPDDKRLLARHYVSINESYLYVIDLATGQATQVNPLPEGKEPVAYKSAVFDGKGAGIFYAGDEDAEFSRLTHIDLKTGKKTVLTPKLAWDVTDIAISKDGKHLAYTANEGGTTGLYLAKTSSPSSATRIALPKGVAGGLAFDPASKRLGFTMSTADSTADVYSVDVTSPKLVRWTESEVGGLNPKIFVTPELIEVASFDGKKIPAWLYTPRGASKEKPAPVLIVIHGGPEAQSVASFSANTQFFVNELGFAVILPNVRGSAGYGKTYLKLDNGFLREDSVKDIGALLDWIATQPNLNASRVAVNGGSYGGYMTLASLVHYGDRLRCGAEQVGISNFVTFLNNTESYRRDLRRAEYGDERDPKMREFLERISPTTNAKKITKPLLVAQGKNDPRVPLSEAEQIVQTVRKNGNQVWYVMAKDEGHGFHKKRNRDYYLNASALFLSQCLAN